MSCVVVWAEKRLRTECLSCFQGLQTSTYVLAMEFFVPAKRPMVGAVMECFWGATVMMLSGLAYALPNWRHLQIAVSLPGLLALFYIWWVSESSVLSVHQ